jgi:hypothetical protein
MTTLCTAHYLLQHLAAVIAGFRRHAYMPSAFAAMPHCSSILHQPFSLHVFRTFACWATMLYLPFPTPHLRLLFPMVACRWNSARRKGCSSFHRGGTFLHLLLGISGLRFTQRRLARETGAVGVTTPLPLRFPSSALQRNRFTRPCCSLWHSLPAPPRAWALMRAFCILAMLSSARRLRGVWLAGDTWAYAEHIVWWWWHAWQPGDRQQTSSGYRVWFDEL